MPATAGRGAAATMGATSGGERVPRRTARRRQFLPPQHGAWAMLVVPYLAALVVGGASWIALPLLGAWLAGYLLSYYAFQAVKSRRAGRYRGQLVLYASIAVPLAAIVVWASPAVAWYAPGFALLLAANVWYAWRRRERALANDIASVLQSCLMVFAAGTAAGVRPAALLGVFAACTAYFLGTVFFVKTMIRERGNPTFRRWSAGVHVGALGIAAWLGPWLAALFAWLLVRAVVMPARRLSPKQVGLIEIGNCVLLLVALWLTA
jgi:hypothetical protein